MVGPSVGNEVVASSCEAGAVDVVFEDIEKDVGTENVVVLVLLDPEIADAVVPGTENAEVLVLLEAEIADAVAPGTENAEVLALLDPEIADAVVVVLEEGATAGNVKDEPVVIVLEGAEDARLPATIEALVVATNVEN